MKPSVVFLLKVVLSVAILTTVLLSIDLAEAFSRLGQADPTYLALAFVAINLQTMLSAIRWRMTARPLGIDLPLSVAIGEYYVTQFANQTLPGGIVGDATRAVRARRHAGFRASALAVIIERLMGQAALAAVVIVALALAMATPGGIAWPPVTRTVLACLIAVSLGVVLALRALWPRVQRTLLAAKSVLSRGGWRPHALISLVIVMLNLASFSVCALATGSALGIEATFALGPLILLAMLVPFAISGWGWREGAAAALFPLAGHSPEAGLAASVAFGILLLLASLPGWVVLLASPAEGAPDREGLPSATPASEPALVPYRNPARE